MTPHNELHQCLCGCGTLVVGYFKRGHSNRFTRRLADVEVGALRPEQAFPGWLLEAMGEWTRVENKDGRTGWKPQYRHYAGIRSNVERLKSK